MKTTKISVMATRGQKHPISSFADFRVSAAMDAELEPGDDLDECFRILQEQIEHAVHKQLIIVNRALGKNVDNDLMKFDHYYRRARSYSEVADAKKE